MYLQLFEQIRHSITTGELRPGLELPPVRTLATALGVSPVTVGRAFENLRSRGLVVSVGGGGVYVADFAKSTSQAGDDRVKSFATEVLRQAANAGLDQDRLSQAIQELIRVPNRTADFKNIVVIDEFDSIDIESLRRSMAGLNVNIVEVTLSEIGESAHLIDQAAFILAAPYCYGAVQESLHDRAQDVVGITLVLSPFISTQMRKIPASSRVVVVPTVPSFQGWVRTVVSARTALDFPPIEVAASDQRALREALSEADVVICGSGCRREVTALAPQGVPVIGLRHIVDEESITRLRLLLGPASTVSK